jgi:gamma-glutamylcyclotransferase (GGCT)/AIG2-like uncharacterized protein YtfP
VADHKLFVYGTLRPGNTPTVEIAGSMHNLGWFPGVKLGGNSKFVAEVLTVDDAELGRLDSYEGYREDDPEHSLYLRVQHDGGWIYVYNSDMSDYPVIEGGDWLARQDNEEFA